MSETKVFPLMRGLREADQFAVAEFAKKFDRATVPQIIVLGALAEAVNPLKQTQITAMTGIDRSTLSEMLQRLGASGHVAATHSTKDTRANLVSITASGRRLLKSAAPYAASVESDLHDYLRDIMRRHKK